MKNAEAALRLDIEERLVKMLRSHDYTVRAAAELNRLGIVATGPDAAVAAAILAARATTPLSLAAADQALGWWVSTLPGVMDIRSIRRAA